MRGVGGLTRRGNYETSDECMAGEDVSSMSPLLSTTATQLF